jgi:citrate synthase
VVAAETSVSEVDGERGVLVLAGEPVQAFSRHRFEEVIAILRSVSGETRAGALDPQAIQVLLATARREAFGRLNRLGDALDAPDAMSALRAGIAHFDACDEDADIHLAGAIPVLAAAWQRRQQGHAPIEPSAAGHTEDMLRLYETSASPEAAAALGAYLATVVDHGLNASTFAARVVASTASDTTSAVVAAIGALKGPLHGGAPGPVLDMLDAIGTADRAEAWITAELKAGRRIMGMGHRVYKVRDPRASALEAAAAALGGAGRIALTHAVEAAAQRVLERVKPGRRLRANVEMWTAVLLDALGIDRTLFTATFAASRVVGWCAHVREQRLHGRLLRPSSRYIGPR